jgi:sec-independent protein translocase protein TatA
MSSTLVPLFGPIPGGMEMVVILLIAVLLFGANKIPKLARSTGQAMGEFQRGREEIEQELEEVKEGGSTDSGSTLEDTESTSTSTTDTESDTDSSESQS